VIVGEKVRLRPKRLEDAFQDYVWRKDPELAELDAASPLQESYEDYLKGYAWELKHPSRHRRRFSIETLSGKYIGHCALFDIDENKREAQLGIMVADRDYWGKGYGTEAVKLLVGYGFNELRLEAINLRSLDWNIRAHKSFQKCGFVPVGRRMEGKLNFVIMRISRREWVVPDKRRSEAVRGREEEQHP
jgi:RimJ/RimL family protein N-acetyltransferase